jgi:hypothetical protein
MNIKMLVSAVCKEKENVIKLNNETLKKYKNNFYSQNYKAWKLDLFWEYIWDDISLEEIKKILKLGDDIK